MKKDPFIPKQTQINLLFIPAIFAALLTQACIKLNPSPLDTYQGEILGWAAIAATPDKFPADPQVRYSANDSSVYGLSLDASCKSSVTGSVYAVNVKTVSPYFSAPAGSYYVAGCTGQCSTTAFAFATDVTYTLTVSCPVTVPGVGVTVTSP